jgi:hypothetical protein
VLERGDGSVCGIEVGPVDPGLMEHAPTARGVPLQRFVPNGEIVVPVEAALDLAPQKGKRRAR